MKKRIIIPAILSAVLATGLTSCVKDNESDSVRDLRNAKANELNANAKQTESATKINEAAAAVKLKSDEAELAKKLADVKKSELDVKIKEFDVKIKELSFATAARVEADAARVSAENAAGSQGRIDAKVIEANAAVVSATAAVASATAALEKAKHNVEIAKLDAEIALAKAQSKKSEVEAATASATLALIKAQQKLAGEKADAYEEAVTDFANAVVSVTTKKGEIEQKKNMIKGLEEGVVTATAYVERQTAVKNANIAARNKAIEVLEASKQYTTAQLKALYQEELAKYENAMNVYSDEFNSRKLEEIAEDIQYIDQVDFKGTNISKAFKDINDFYQANPSVLRRVAYNLPESGGYFEPFAYTLDQQTLTNGMTEFADYYTRQPVKINVVMRQAIQHAVAEIEQEAVGNQIELDKLNGDATNSYSVAYAETKMNEAKTAWEEAKAAQPPVEATINARWTTYQSKQTDYRNKLHSRKQKESDLAPVNKHKELYNKAIAQLSTAGLENYNAVVTKRNEAVAKHFKQEIKEENLKLAANEFNKKASEYKAILDGTGSSVTDGTYEYIDHKINEHKEAIEKLKAEIATFSEIITAEDALNKEKQQLAKLEAELVALEAKVVALKAKADALKP